jgi:hypothetical protein
MIANPGFGCTSFDLAITGVGAMPAESGRINGFAGHSDVLHIKLRTFGAK